MRMVQRAVYTTASRFFRLVPFGFALVATSFVADIVFLVNSRLRNIVANNIKQVRRGSANIEHGNLRRQARLVFRHFSKYFVEFFRCRPAPELLANGTVLVEGIEHLNQAISRGRGVVITSAHLGNWELGGAVLAALGYPVNAVTFRQSDPYLERLFQAQRDARGYRSIMMDRTPASLVKRLQQGEIVALLSDWDITGNGYETDFFGRRTSMPRGPAWLSFKTGAPIVPCFTLFRGGDRYCVQFECPINPDAKLTKVQIQEMIQRTLEAKIVMFPEQWLIFHDFWVQRPT